MSRIVVIVLALVLLLAPRSYAQVAEGTGSEIDGVIIPARLKSIPAANPDQLLVTVTAYSYENPSESLSQPFATSPQEFAALLAKAKNENRIRKVQAISMRATEGELEVVTLNQQVNVELSVTLDETFGHEIIEREISVDTRVCVQWTKVEDKYRVEFAYEVGGPQRVTILGTVPAIKSKWVNSSAEVELGQVYVLAGLGKDKKYLLLTLAIERPE